MNVGEILMAVGAAVWLVGEGIGLFKTGDTTSKFIKIFDKTAWWHRALVVLVLEALAAHFNGLLF